MPSAQYQCKVYIDQNQDGKFEEGLADVDGSGDADDSDDTGEVYYEGDVFTAGDGEHEHYTGKTFQTVLWADPVEDCCIPQG